MLIHFFLFSVHNYSATKICKPGYCKNGGTCIVVGTKPFCKCPPSYLPPDCGDHTIGIRLLDLTEFCSKIKLVSLLKYVFPNCMLFGLTYLAQIQVNVIFVTPTLVRMVAHAG